MQCPYYQGTTVTSTKAEIGCGKPGAKGYARLSYDLKEDGKKEAYKEMLAVCVNNTPDRAYSSEPCRPYLFRELERLGGSPQSYHHTVPDLQQMYIQLVPQVTAENIDAKQEDSIMADLITTAPAGELQAKAYELHQYIIAQARVAGQAISEIGRSLKEMRDNKLYLELGHETFEAYTEQMLNIKQRQAYNYISIYETYGPKFIDAHANLGISKLLLLQAVPAYEREEFMQEHNVADLTTRELKELTEKYTKACEQLTFLQEQNKSLDSKLSSTKEEQERAAQREEELKAEKIALEKRIKELESRPVDVAVAQPSAEQLTAIRKEAEKAAAEKHKAELNKAVEEAQKKALQEAEAKLKEVKEAAKHEAEEKLKASLQAVEKEKAEALERAKQLEKKLSISTNPDSVLFEHLFNELQGTYNRLVGIIKKLAASDAESAAKLKDAVRKLLEMLIKQLEA